MTEVQKQNYSNKRNKKTISKVTTAKSSRKYSANDDQLQGIVKSFSFQTLYPIQPHQYIKIIRKNMFSFAEYNRMLNQSSKRKQSQSKPIIIDSGLWKFTISVMKKFELNYETIGLGVCFYIKHRLTFPFIDQRQLYLKKFQISVCIYLAAKTIQLERKIPKPSAFQYFCGQNYTSEDYNKFERQLVQVLSYDLQRTTIFTFLHLYLSMGIFYQHQIFQTGKKIQQLQQEILQKGLQSLSTCQFLNFQSGNLERQAIKIVKQVRKKYYMTQENKNLQPLWNKQNSSTNSSKFSSCLKYTKSMGNLLDFSRSASYYTQRKNMETLETIITQNQTGLISRKNNRCILKNNKLSQQGNELLKRKPNIDKSHRQKTAADERKCQQAQNFKYVTLKDQNIFNSEEGCDNRSLIRCKSASSNLGSLVNVSIKYQKNSCLFNLESRNISQEQKQFEYKTQATSNIAPSLLSKVDQKKIINTLKLSQSSQCLNRVFFEGVQMSSKLSKFAGIKEDKIIQKSRSKSRHSSETSIKKIETFKHFHRKNYTNIYTQKKTEYNDK